MNLKRHLRRDIDFVFHIFNRVLRPKSFVEHAKYGFPL